MQVATSLPAEDGTLDITQKLPANLDQLAIIVKKLGETSLKSPQLREQREMPADGEIFIAGTGGPVAAGQLIQLTVEGIPHHPQSPRRIALAIATWSRRRRRFATRPTATPPPWRPSGSG